MKSWTREETEEQQVEALKKWWTENASVMILGVAIGASVLFGWRYYDNYKIQHAEEASSLYDSVLTTAAANDPLDKQQTRVNTLSEKQWQEIADCCRKILNRAIAAGGATISDFLGSSGQPGYFQLPAGGLLSPPVTDRCRGAIA